MRRDIRIGHCWWRRIGEEMGIGEVLTRRDRGGHLRAALWVTFEERDRLAAEVDRRAEEARARKKASSNRASRGYATRIAAARARYGSIERREQRIAEATAHWVADGWSRVEAERRAREAYLPTGAYAGPSREPQLSREAQRAAVVAIAESRTGDEQEFSTGGKR